MAVQALPVLFQIAGLLAFFHFYGWLARGALHAAAGVLLLACAGFVAWMARHAVPAEVVSEEEWDLALRLGHEPSRVIVNGPIKTPRLLAEALDAGAVVNLDSHREVRWVIERAARGEKVDTVGLRVNWNVERDAPGQLSSGWAGFSRATVPQSTVTSPAST